MGKQVGTGGFPAFDDPAGDAGMDGVQEQFREPSSEWQPMETVPKDRLIDIWIKGSNGDGGTRWCDCYYDQICDEWRTSRPSGRLMCIKARFVSYWMPRPADPPRAES